MDKSVTQIVDQSVKKNQ